MFGVWDLLQLQMFQSVTYCSFLSRTDKILFKESILWMNNKCRAFPVDLSYSLLLNKISHVSYKFSFQAIITKKIVKDLKFEPLPLKTNSHTVLLSVNMCVYIHISISIYMYLFNTTYLHVCICFA